MFSRGVLQACWCDSVSVARFVKFVLPRGESLIKHRRARVLSPYITLYTRATQQPLRMPSWLFQEPGMKSYCCTDCRNLAASSPCCAIQSLKATGCILLYKLVPGSIIGACTFTLHALTHVQVGYAMRSGANLRLQLRCAKRSLTNRNSARSKTRNRISDSKVAPS